VSPRTPTGFYVASVCAAAFGVLMAMAGLVMDDGGGPGWGAIPGRAAAGLLAALSAVAAEALWRARPWAWRASRALAVTYAALVVTVCAAIGETAAVFVALWILIPSAMVVAPLLMYIRNRSADLFGTPFIPRPPVHPPAPYPPASALHRPPPPPPPLPPGRRPPPWW